MKKYVALVLMLIPLAVSGCATKTGSAAAGAVGGAAAGGGVYEYRLHEEMKRIESDYRAGKMDQREYQIRKDEIQRLEVIK